MKTIIVRVLAFCCAAIVSLQAAYTDASDRPFAVDTYIDKNAAEIVEWATGYQDYIQGTHLSDTWKTPERALGPAVGGSYDIVSLGRGGQITLTFTNPIRNGEGADFCVFENGFSDTFLELAWVEVSTDGEHYVRFPNFSTTLNPTASNIDPSQVFGLASRYRSGRGTVFDLEQLKLAHNAALVDETDFSAEYEAHLEANFPHLVLEDIRYVRLVDVVGDGSALDADGYVIYDAYPTTGSAGLDLDAVGVLNSSIPDGLAQEITFLEIPHQLFADSSLELSATASSGLAVEYEISEGSPATLDGSTLTFTGTGTIEVVANQPGDADFNAAASVLRSFVVADALQHIYFAPISNQIVSGADVSLLAFADSGLPVQLEVTSGPDGVLIGPAPEYALTVGDETGSVTIRAWQAGNDSYAPAEDVFLQFEIVTAGAATAPRSFSQWQSAYSVTGDGSMDSDGDGVNDFIEYVAGTNPLQASSSMPPIFVPGADGNFLFTVQVSRRAAVEVVLKATSSLGDAWVDAVPEMISLQDAESGGEPIQVLQLRVRPDAEPGQGFWQFHFEGL